MYSGVLMANILQYSLINSCIKLFRFLMFLRKTFLLILKMHANSLILFSRQAMAKYWSIVLQE